MHFRPGYADFHTLSPPLAVHALLVSVTGLAMRLHHDIARLRMMLTVCALAGLEKAHTQAFHISHEKWKPWVRG